MDATHLETAILDRHDWGGGGAGGRYLYHLSQEGKQKRQSIFVSLYVLCAVLFFFIAPQTQMHTYSLLSTTLQSHLKMVTLHFTICWSQSSSSSSSSSFGIAVWNFVLAEQSRLLLEVFTSVEERLNRSYILFIVLVVVVVVVSILRFWIQCKPSDRHENLIAFTVRCFGSPLGISGYSILDLARAHGFFRPIIYVCTLFGRVTMVAPTVHPQKCSTSLASLALKTRRSIVFVFIEQYT